jgi:anti-sigma factor RsiW
MTRPPRSPDPAERLLDELLQRAPRHAAPESLHRRLRLLVAPRAPATAAPRTRWSAALAPALAAGLVLVAGGVLVGRGGRDGGEPAAVAAEAVHDHLRVLARQQPPDVADGGPHRVKPWFEGRLDFAPDVPVPAGDVVRLKGGSVGYVFDRKAAVLEYAVHGHAATLLVFRAEGLSWPRAGQATQAGWHVVLWRSGDLGYALVSDLSAGELAEVAAALGARGAR